MSFITKYMRNGTSNEMAVNGSVTPVEFIYSPEVGTAADVYTGIFQIEDDGAFKAGGFAKQADPLVNGIEIFIRDISTGSTSRDMLDGEFLRENGHFDRVFTIVEYRDYGTGSTNKFLSCRWEFPTSRFPILAHDEELVIRINDDLSGVVNIRAMMHGNLRKL